jgi:ABC-2 type transport system permease protein
MKKIWLIGWKDVMLAARDPSALVFMLAAPFLLTLGMALVTGRFSSADSGPSGIPVVVVNQDGGQLGTALIDVFESEALSTLLTTSIVDSPDTAREQVESDAVAAAVIVPEGFTDNIIPKQGTTLTGDVVQIELYANPTRPTSVAIVQTVVDTFVSRVEIGAVSGQVAVMQLIENGLIEISDAPRIGRDIGLRQAEADVTSAIKLNTVGGEGTTIKFDVLAYMAPGMAMMFLMYVVSNGGRTILRERDAGTLPRLLISPTTVTQVLGGKVLGIFLTGVAQMGILIGASALLFRLNWGNPFAVVLLVLASVTGAVGWGLLITAASKTQGQVGAIGSAMMLTFGILGGSFFEVDYMPVWFRVLNKITPNAWSVDGFTTLARGGSLSDIAGSIVALLVMGGVLFAIAAFLFNRRGIAEA